MADQDDDIQNDDIGLVERSSNFDLLREINANKGEGMTAGGKSAAPQAAKPAAAAPPAADTTKTDVAKPGADAAKPGTDDANKDTGAKDTPPSTKMTTKTIPKDPAFVKSSAQSTDDKSAAPDKGKEATDASKGAGAANPNEQEPDTSTIFPERLSELTGGTIATEEQFVELLQDYNELLEEKEKGFEPQYSDERTKKVHQLLTNLSPGESLEQAARIVQTLRLTPDKMESKELLFEGFMLEPENSDLTREKAWDLFEDFYEKTYSSDDKLTKRKAEVDARKAKDTIVKMQQEYLKKDEDTSDADSQNGKQPVISPETITSIRRAIGEFGGLELSFFEDGPESELMRVSIEDDPEGKAEIQQLQQYTENPGLWWTDFISGFKTKEGNFDHPSFVNEMYQIINHKKLVKLAVNHGMEIQKTRELNKARNSSDVNRDDVKQAGRVPAGVEKEGSFYDAFEKALNGGGR